MCGVWTTALMCNRVTNPSDMGIFSKQAPAVYIFFFQVFQVASVPVLLQKAEPFPRPLPHPSSEGVRHVPCGEDSEEG